MTSEQKERTVGFELEYAAVPLPEAAAIVVDLYGGDAHSVSDAEIEVRETEFGTFRLELDAEPVKKLAEAVRDEKTLKAVPRLFRQLYISFSSDLSKTASKMGALIAPFEIVTPPIPESRIEALEPLRDRLRAAKVKDTTDALIHAFGMHINPEAPGLEPENILRHIKAFGLLFPYLRQAHDMDITRRLSMYAEPYTDAYLDLVTDDDYAPGLDQLITDYHAHNKSRNRALDMLPLFAHLNEGLVRSLYGKDEKINPRPTYHYRLPNSEVGDASWSFGREWSLWLLVEAAARDDAILSRLDSIRGRRQEAGLENLLEGSEGYAREIEAVISPLLQ